MKTVSFLDVAADLAGRKGLTRKEYLRSHSYEQVLAEAASVLGIRFAAKFQIDPAILEAGDVVAAHLGIPRKQVFRQMSTPEVVAMAGQLKGAGDGDD